MKNLLLKFKWLSIGAFVAWFVLPVVVYAVSVSVPQSGGKGYWLSGLATGNYQTNTPCSNGLVLAASSTSSTGWACVSTSGSSGLTSLSGMTGPAITLATTSDTNLGLNIITGSNNATFTPTWIGTLADGRITSATNWNGVYNNVLSRLVTGTTTTGSGITISTTTNSYILNIPTADASHTGQLTSTDWSTFNSKQSAGNYITALTGDVTASGPGSVASTLATVNSNIGTFGSTSQIPQFTVNGKGLVTAASNLTPSLPASAITSGVLPVANGGTATTSLGNLTLTSSNLSFGSGDGKLILIGTSTNITLAASPSFTNGTFTGTLGVTGASTLASTTISSTTVTGNLVVQGTPTLSGVSNCTGTSFLQISSGLFGCAIPAGGGGGGSGGGWATTTPATIYNSFGNVVGINSSTPVANLVVEGTAASSTLPVFIVASSTNATLFQVAPNGTTTVSNLIAGLIQSTASGQLFNGKADLTAQVVGVLPVANGGTGTSTAPTQQGQLLIADSTGAKYAPGTLLNTSTLTWATGTVQQLSGNVLKVPNALTFNNSGSGASSGQTFDGSAAATISYNTVGAQVAGTYLGNTNVSGTSGQLPYFSAANTLNSTAVMLYNGSVFGMNATSSTIGFNIQGTAGTNDIFNLASSTGTSILKVTAGAALTLTGSMTVTATSTLATTTITSLSLNGIPVKATFDKSTPWIASTTLDSFNVSFSTGTSTWDVWNPSYAVTLKKLYCKTDTGTVLLNFGGNLLSCTSGGASSTPSTNYAVEANMTFSVGSAASSPNRVKLTATFQPQ